MEYEDFNRSIDYLIGREIVISTFVSDRHSSIAKHMREKKTDIIQYFDLWHLKKSKTNVKLKIIYRFIVRIHEQIIGLGL